MSLPIRLLPEGKEFDAAVDWYEGKQAGLGAPFIARVRYVLKGISATPRMHAVATFAKQYCGSFPISYYTAKNSTRLSLSRCSTRRVTRQFGRTRA